MGEYGGPAFPFVALGGAPKNVENGLVEYYDSEALIITLEVDNYNSGENLKRAKVWESNFI